jgi:Ca-activated chloride channel family protein
MTIKLRYKEPVGEKSRLMVTTVYDDDKKLGASSDNFRFSASVAAFGLLLRNSEFKQNANYEAVIRLASSAKGKDAHGYRAEFIELVRSTTALAKN